MQTVYFRSEQSLAAFIQALDKHIRFRVEEDPAHAGRYTLYLNEAA